MPLVRVVSIQDKCLISQLARQTNVLIEIRARGRFPVRLDCRQPRKKALAIQLALSLFDRRRSVRSIFVKKRRTESNVDDSQFRPSLASLPAGLPVRTMRWGLRVRLQRFHISGRINVPLAAGKFKLVDNPPGSLQDGTRSLVALQFHQCWKQGARKNSGHAGTAGIVRGCDVVWLLSVSSQQLAQMLHG